MIRRRMRVAVVALAAGATAATVASAGGQPVALRIPAARVCANGHGSIVAGVQYTANPPGPRRFSVDVRNPRGRVVLHREGIAPRRWRSWEYDPPALRRALGTYTTTYDVSSGREVFRTRVVFCG
jgi:hypothetical protein